MSCGEALVDVFPSPEPDGKPLAVPGGGPMNVAVTVARLGVPAAFVGRLSTDDFGEQIWRHLEENGVLTVCVERGDEPTARAIVEHTPKLGFRFEGESTADSALEMVDLSGLPTVPQVVHGGTLGLFRGATAHVLAAFVEQFGGVVSLDPNIRPQLVADRAAWTHFHQRWLRRTHVYKASDEDVSWIWPGRSIDSVADELLSQTSRLVAITRGSDGASLFSSAGRVDVVGTDMTVIDTVGAGDTFIGALLAQLWLLGYTSPSAFDGLSVADMNIAGSAAVAAAEITCSRAGANPPTHEELGLVLKE